VRGSQSVALGFDSWLRGLWKEFGQSEDVGAVALLIADVRCCTAMAGVRSVKGTKRESARAGGPSPMWGGKGNGERRDMGHEVHCRAR
jgi:hypothetical protein